jgi:hypothetical protein
MWLQSSPTSPLFHVTRRLFNNTSISVEIPTSVHSFLPRQLFPPGHTDTIIRPHKPIHIGAPATAIPPLLEIVYLLQCFLPGVIAVPHDSDELADRAGRTLPDVKWLLARDMLLRKAFGCTYFRYLVDAAGPEKQSLAY